MQREDSPLQHEQSPCFRVPRTRKKGLKMIFVRQIEFKRKFRNFVPKTIIDLNRDITLLVGDQGTGKTTILQELTKGNKSEEIETKMVGKDEVFVCSFDAELNNPRNKQRIETGYDVVIRWKSHGEALFPIIKSSEKFSNQIILIDEPESGLSIRSQHLIVDSLLKSSSKNQLSQLILRF